MNSPQKNLRRKFIKQMVSGSMLGISGMSTLPAFPAPYEKTSNNYISPNDQIQVGIIGLGIMGFNNARQFFDASGVKLVGGCDLYQGRLNRSQELFGKDFYTTTNYQELLSRADIDAVVIATTDHWHDKISIDAMEAGKHVYCEKPMVHHLEEGHAVIATQEKTKKVFQVGSQRVSSLVYEKAKEIYSSGTIGQLIMADIWYDRHSALGAWQYSIPLDASEKTVDWKAFQGDAPPTPFDPVKFFRWRNYQEYGTGVAGDLFVHLFSGLHLITGSLGPERIYGTGGLRYWKDGRNVPDVILGSYDYPETENHPSFNVQMRVNFVDGGGGGSKIRLIGSEGLMTIGNRGVEVVHNAFPEAPGYGGWDSYNTFDTDNQKAFEDWYTNKYGKEQQIKNKEDIKFQNPRGQSDHKLHVANFLAGIRDNKPIIEDASFGLRAAGPALATNMSYFQQKIIHWDPVGMKVV